MRWLKSIIMILVFSIVLCGCGRNSNIEKSDSSEEKNDKMEIKETENESLPEKNETESEEKKEEQEETQEEEYPIPEEVTPISYRILIDPGHFAGCNPMTTADGSTYSEGDHTLDIAKGLQKILTEEYGITAELTRTEGDITMGGYTNADLDKGHISLRGEASAGYDLFVSIHTNANQENANGAPTTEQPVGINKPLVILNMIGKENDSVINIANQIGLSITDLYKEKGLTNENFQFSVKTSGNEIGEWTDEQNDAIAAGGTLYVRTGQKGDYYGVLRGASNVGTPGMIIEHGFHTVPEFRRQIISDNLAEDLARADAEGIARGLGILKH